MNRTKRTLKKLMRRMRRPAALMPVIALLVCLALPATAYGEGNPQGSTKTGNSGEMTNVSGATMDENAESSTIDVNNGTVKVNKGSIGITVMESDTMGEGLVVTNNGTIGQVGDGVYRGYVTTNGKDGTVTVNCCIVETNNGTVGTNDGTVTLNNGVVETNDKGTVEENGADGMVYVNRGTVKKNGGTIPVNPGKVTENNGAIGSNSGFTETNNGYVDKIEEEGAVGINGQSGTVNVVVGELAQNNGLANENQGVVWENNGTVDRNVSGVIANKGSVNTNSSYVADNYGTVTTNDGVIQNNMGAVFMNNEECAIATNWEDGAVTVNLGAINKNLGAVVINGGEVTNAENGSVEINMGTVREADGRTFHGVLFTKNNELKALGQAEDGVELTYRESLGESFGKVMKKGYRVTFNGKSADDVFSTDKPVSVELLYSAIARIKALQESCAAGEAAKLQLTAANAETLLKTVEVYCDGEKVAAEDYALDYDGSGALTLSFTEEFLGALNPGEHTVSLFIAGGSCASFTLVK